jgi:hypothetical protein
MLRKRRCSAALARTQNTVAVFDVRIRKAETTKIQALPDPDFQIVLPEV